MAYRGAASWRRFTVDSRPEIGVTASTRVYVDVNGNFTSAPRAVATLRTRTSIFQLGLESDAYFAGNFAAANAVNASGFDKLGVFGFDPFLGQYRFRWISTTTACRISPRRCWA